MKLLLLFILIGTVVARSTSFNFEGKSWKFVYFPLGPIQANCVLVYNAVTDTITVFDPGSGDADDIRLILRKANEISPTATITDAIFTHGHVDHIAGAAALKRVTNCRLLLNKDDETLWNSLSKQLSMFGIRMEGAVPSIDGWLHDGDVLDIGCKAIHVPGHSPGSMAFLFSGGNAGKDLLIAGDTLFHGSIGRTDFMGGDSDKIRHSITQVLYTLKPDTTVICGHGDTTTIRHEMLHGVFRVHDSL